MRSRTVSSRRTWTGLSLLGGLALTLAALGSACGSDDSTTPGPENDGGNLPDTTGGPQDGAGGDVVQPPKDSGGKMDGTAGDGGKIDGAVDSGIIDANAFDTGVNCKPVMTACSTGSDCCSGLCDPKTNTCSSSVGQCSPGGAHCTSKTDCCSLVCDINGLCGSGSCTSDNQPCTTDQQCCGGKCSPAPDGGAGNVCAPANPLCKTAGNTCTTSAECCSGLCDPVKGTCQLASSFCIQPGDICSRDNDCCTGICDKGDAGASLGLCIVPPNGGRNNCSGKTDGVLCSSCGECCSALCAPYVTGVSVCQPANGCHVEGDLCRSNSDCCGGDPDSGLPGAGNVVCMIAPGNPVGYCSSPNSCRPEGDTCAFKNYACSNSTKSDNCCDALGRMSGGCQLDKEGVPRCIGVGECQGPGQSCADSLDCCNGLPCVPGADGGLICAALDGGSCEPSAGPCTVDADCCSGLTCIVPPGGTQGQCGLVVPPPPPPPPPPDGGPVDAAGVDAAGLDAGTDAPITVTDSGTLSCSLYGQGCTQNSDCCNGVPCTLGGTAQCNGASGCVCVYPIK